MLTEETKVLIDTELDKLFAQLEDTIVFGVTEDMSPNDIEYDQTLDDRWESAMEYLEKRVGYYK
jgi:hypothetical protein